MDNYDKFFSVVSEIAEKFDKVDKNKTLRLISHLDADGICACSILVKLLNKQNRKYTISIVQQLTSDVLNSLAKENYEYYFFTDLGSGQLSYIEEHLKDKKVFIFDHHQPEKDTVNENIVQLNPHLAGIDGSREISGAGVVYFFARAVDNSLDNLAHIAIIGAIGDIQENNGFLKLNNDILELAVKHDKIKVIKGLRVFGAQTRALHKVLEYCTDPYIPGVSGSESGSIQFLHSIGINPKEGNEWKKIVNLTKDELQKLVAGIVLKRAGEDNPEDILGNVYILKDEEKESETRDAKEFSTLLNACGRMEFASVGIGVCLGDPIAKKRAIKKLAEYKKEIINAMEWYNKSKESGFVKKGEGYLIINSRDAIMPSIIGTLSSIIARSNELPAGTFVMGIAQNLDGTSKVSLRLSGRKNETVDLREIIKMITDQVGGEAGGHMNAAGANINIEDEEKFIETAKLVLARNAMEEVIN